MASFSDDFNRPDGGIGNGWSTSGTGVNISGGEVLAGATRYAYRAPFSHSGFQRARVDVNSTLPPGHYAIAVVRYNPADRSHYEARYQSGSLQQQVSIRKYVGSTGSILVQVGWAPPSSGYHTVELVYDSGVLIALVDGVERCRANDNAFEAYDDLGFGLLDMYSRADNFYCDDVNAAAFDAAPEPIVQLAQSQGLTFTGTGTNWTPGTPGVPTFTVDKGTLSNQSISDATHATADYEPPQADDVATFTDPSTGETDAVALSTGFQVESGGSGSADDYFDTVQAGGISPSSFLSIIEMLNSLLPGQTPDLSIINKIWAGDEDVGGVNPILQNIQNNWATLDTWRLAGPWPTPTFREMLESLAGTGGALDMLEHLLGEANWSLQGVVNALAGVPNLSHQDLNDAIAAIPPIELALVTEYLDYITSTRTYNFASVLQAVDGVDTRVADALTDTIAYLDWITGTKAHSLSELATLVTTVQGLVNGVHDDLAADYSALTNAGARNLQELYDWLLNTHGDVSSLDTFARLRLNFLTNNGTISLATLLTWLNDIMSRSNDIFSDTQAIKTKVNSLQNTDLSGVNATLARIEGKIDTLLAVKQPIVRPLWPGLASVTFGGIVALTPQTVVNGPLDGVIIDVGDVNSAVGKKDWGNTRSFYRLGYVTFVDDEGAYEPLQPIVFTSNIITPTSMQRAARCEIIVRNGTSGSVAPWTRT